MCNVQQHIYSVEGTKPHLTHTSMAIRHSCFQNKSYWIWRVSKTPGRCACQNARLLWWRTFREYDVGTYGKIPFRFPGKSLRDCWANEQRERTTLYEGYSVGTVLVFSLVTVEMQHKVFTN